MKTKLILILVLISIKTIAQTEPCGTTGFNQLSQAKTLQLQSPQTYDPDAKHVLNVRFTMVNNENNQNFCTLNNIPFGEADYLEIIKILNINFNPFNIFFKYYGTNTINLDNSLLPQTNQDILPLSDYLTDQSEKDAINIYFLQQLRQPTQTPTPTASYQYAFGEAILGRPIILLSLPSYVGIYPLGNGSCQDYLMEKDFLVCHEMGHALGLHHVWNNWDNQITTNPYLLAEHVTREPLNPDGSVNTNYNADIAGDFVSDTPVTRSELYAINYDEDDCTLKNLDSPTFPMRDIQGTLFDFENIKYDNFMLYIYKVNNTNCGTSIQLPSCDIRKFTPGQGEAMRKFIQNIPYVYTNFGETGYTSTNFNFTLTYLESLYEPFFVGGGGSNSGYPSVALQKNV